jgi:hypothetical protein
MSEADSPRAEDNETLQRAGFMATAVRQERFVADVAGRRTAIAELPQSKTVQWLAAGALAGAFAALTLARGNPEGAYAAFGALLGHGALAFRAWTTRRARSVPEAEPHPAACFRDGEGVLRLVLDPGEEVLRSARADGPTRPRLRQLAGVTQMLWGVILGGLPIAAAAGGVSTGTLLLMGLGTLVGTAFFGRGVESLTSVRPVERIVLTNRRIAALGAPGMAHSIPLVLLPNRPVVVGRDGGRATVAIATRPLRASSPLPFPALYGVHDLDDEQAQAWAKEAMDARKELLGS